MSNPPQLHLSLPPNTTSFKRSFEQFGFDLESPASTLPRSREDTDGTSTTASGESSSTASSGDENRRKRARSASSLSEPEDRSSEASSSTLSSFDSEPSSSSPSNSSHAAARRHLLLDLGLGRGLGSSVALGLSMASAELQLGGGRAIPEPPPRIPTPELLESEDVEMADIDMDFSHPVEHEEGRTSHAEHVQRSVDRFNAFDRHISVLRSSSPPVIPLPTSLNSRQASLSPPTLPPLPLVDLGLDAEDDDDDDHEHIPSTQATNTTASTPPRLDLNLPPATSLSSAPSSPTATRDESSTQFRERLDSAIDGLGGGDLHFEAPIIPPTYNSSAEQRPDDDRSFERYFPLNDSMEATTSASGANSPTHRTRPFVETPLFEWPPALDWNMTLGPPTRGSSNEVAQPLRSPAFSSWRPHVRPANATAAMDTTSADIRRFIATSYSPPPPPPPPTRLYPRPPSLAAPLSVPASTSSLEAAMLDADLVDAYLDFRRSNSNSRAWESALDRARTLHRERDRERAQEMERIRLAERERERERDREREREEEMEREREHPWSLDSIWEANARAESSTSSARPRPWESLTLRARRELTEDNGRELDMEFTRRRAMQREIHRNMDTERERERQREEQHERGQSSVSRAARYLESGLVDPREASRPVTNNSVTGMERRLRPPLDTSNPFNISWGPSRGTQLAEEDTPASRPTIHRSRTTSQGGIDWITRSEQDEDHTPFDTFDEWFNSEPPTSRSTNPRPAPLLSTYDREGSDYARGSGGESSSSGELWRTRSTGTWQPRLAVSPQSTAQPTRTTTHARAQSIPASSLSSMSSIAPQPSLHRLRTRLYGPSRAAGVGSSNSLVAENAAAIRRREARTELMERLNRTMSLDIDDPEPGWEPRLMQRARNPPRPVLDDDDDEMDSDDDRRRIAAAIERIESRPPPPFLRTLRFHRRSDSSPSRQGPSLPQRLPSGLIRPRSPVEPEAEEQPSASSSGLNSRRPLSIHPRRTVQRLRNQPISGEISPPPLASASVDRRHVSWEAPSRDAGVSSTYQYLSALSHGFDSQSLSISDLAQTITSNSHTEETRRTPPSPMWGETESPFTLFTRSATAPSPQRSARYTRGQDDTMDAVDDSSVPSLPPPDLGRNFERAEDVLASANADGTRASPAVATPTSESPTTSYTRPPTPPSTNPYTGPFRLTMQRREEARRVATASQRRIPDPPSIPPLYFGADFDNASTSPPSAEVSGTRQRQSSSQRPQSYQAPPSRSELAHSARFMEIERRLFNYRGPAQGSTSDADPRRFFPSRPTTTASTSTSTVDQDPEEPRGHRYSATDMHHVLARQARLEGSRLPADLPRTSRADMEGIDITHDGFRSSRAHRLIPRYPEQAEAETRESSSSTSPWANLPSRRFQASAETLRADVEAHRRRATTSRPMHEGEPVGFRHRAFRDPSFHAMFANHGFPGPATARFRRRALGDYMRDEDFDGSYETLLSLGGIIGDAKPKATPDDVVSGLETASYKDWATSESDQRCPICLDDYQASDPVMKLGDCRHWLHKECLEQWLKGASTCPVCRKDVKGKAKRVLHHRHHHHHHGPSRRRDGDGPGGSGGPGTSGGSGGGSGDPPHANWLNFLRD